MPGADSDEFSLSLGPFLSELAHCTGRLATDPRVVELVTTRLGKKVPTNATKASNTKHVTAPKLGVELLFDRSIRNDRYPLVAKTKGSFVPYLTGSFLSKKLPEPLPFGVKHGMSPAELEAALGEPILRNESTTVWQRDVIPSRDVVLKFWKDGTVMLVVKEAHGLAEHGLERRPSVGVFLGWAIQKGFLDESRFAAHAELVTRIRNREAKASELVVRALPHGLWDDHFRDIPGFRDFTHGYFHNMGKKFIRDDLVEVFGSREGPYGHAEPILDDDDWSLVDRATPAFDRRFADFISR
jgi:hypothetical protein